jgi:hypothetical protein
MSPATVWVNSFGKFSRGSQRCTVELLEPSLRSQSGEQRLQRFVVVKGDVRGVERRDSRRGLRHYLLDSLLHTGTGSRHLNDSNG